MPTDSNEWKRCVVTPTESAQERGAPWVYGDFSFPAGWVKTDDLPDPVTGLWLGRVPLNDGPSPSEVDRIEALMGSGHTYHCSARQVWGDGACECPGDGTGSPYHTMNPPPGGWPKREPVVVPFDASEALRRLKTEQRVSMGDLARAWGLSVVQVSALCRGEYVVEGQEVPPMATRIDPKPGDTLVIRGVPKHTEVEKALSEAWANADDTKIRVLMLPAGADLVLVGAQRHAIREEADKDVWYTLTDDGDAVLPEVEAAVDWLGDYEAGTLFLERDGDGVAVLGADGVLYTPEGPATHNGWRSLPTAAQIPDGLGGDPAAARLVAWQSAPWGE